MREGATHQRSGLRCSLPFAGLDLGLATSWLGVPLSLPLVGLGLSLAINWVWLGDVEGCIGGQLILGSHFLYLWQAWIWISQSTWAGLGSHWRVPGARSGRGLPQWFSCCCWRCCWSPCLLLPWGGGAAGMGRDHGCFGTLPSPAVVFYVVWAICAVNF